MINIKDNFLKLETNSTCLVFEIKDFKDESTPFNKGRKYLHQFFYGFKDECPKLKASPNVLPGHGSDNDYNYDCLISSTYGNGNQKEPMILLENNDHTYVNRFFFKEYRKINGSKDIKGPHTRNVEETLEIVECDDSLNLELHHYYSLLKDSDIIVAKKELVNKSNLEVKILRFFSLELPINTQSVDIETFDGAWLFEKNRHVTTLNSGTFYIDSKVGSSSHRHNPYIQIKDNARKDVFYGFNLIYSGNHKEQVEVNPLQYTSVMIGINDFGFSYSLKKQESFITPEAIFTIKHCQDCLTKEMHSFVKHHIINPTFINQEKPVLFNNWEGTGMKIDEKSLLEMAVIAKQCGIELFVMDDGWFKNRVTDSGGLGDWEVDLNKFPHGLNSFVNKVKSLGLKFGIWIEPEMICVNSDLYKAHPEFACIIPGREPIERRHQLMIDMSNPKVVDYLYNSLIKVFDEIKPDYIKWDYNRFFSDFYSPNDQKPGELLHRFILGSYDLLERLTKRYPQTLFEGCASGGGRFDLGILYYNPQIWGSDDTNTYFRTFITCGSLTGYPQSTLGAHVSRDHSPSVTRNAVSSLEDRFNLNSVGAFGYEFDFRTFNKEELQVISSQICYYKLHRRLLQNGQLYIIDNCFDDDRYFSFNVVSDDQEEAILFIEETRKDVPSKFWKVKGLNKDYRYLVEMRKQSNLSISFTKEYLGQELMDKGLDIGALSNTNDVKDYPNGVFTRLFYIKKI